MGPVADVIHRHGTELGLESVSPVLLTPLTAAQGSLIVPTPPVIHGVILVCTLQPCVS